MQASMRRLNGTKPKLYYLLENKLKTPVDA